jgi:hypothetical protein
VSDGFAADDFQVTVYYSCPRCSVVDKPVVLRCRRPGEDVSDWVNFVIGLIATDHRRLFPSCGTKTLHDLKIPVAGSEYIGGPPIH